MITSKITSKAQTTIPQPVRAALHVGEGDELVFPRRRSCVLRRSPRWMHEMRSGSVPCPAAIEKPLHQVCAAFLEGRSKDAGE